MTRSPTDLDRRLRLAMWPIGLATIVVGELGFFVHHTAPRETFPLDLAVSTVSIVAGLILWQRRPDNNSGRLLVLAGMLWAIPGIRSFNNPWAFGFGEWLAGLNDAVFAHLLLAYPTGRLDTRPRRVLVAIAYGVNLLGLVSVLFLNTRTCQCYPVRNAFGIWDNLPVHDALHDISGAIVIVLGLVGLAMVALRWWQASPVGRRVFSPVLAVGLLFALAVIADKLASPTGDDPAWTFFPLLIVRIAIPLSFAYGLLRGRLEQVGVGDLVVRLHGAGGSVSTRDSLAVALHDRSLELVYWVPHLDSFVDHDGHPVQLPPDHRDRAVTRIEVGEVLLGAVVHDPALLENPRLVEAATAAASLSLDNERLTAELRSQIDEVRASRARIVEAGDQARRAIERDLHDGAQQRLLALALSLRVAEDGLAHRPDPGARQALDRAAREMLEIIADLRDLAQGIHPAVLTEQGLAAAVETLAERAPLPVGVDIGEERYPATVEAAAYFVVSEGLANVVKHARASRADVSMVRDGGRLVIEVRDDGVGGADPSRGTGLLGLADRVAAADGVFVLDSAPGNGTRLGVVLPCP